MLSVKYFQQLKFQQETYIYVTSCKEQRQMLSLHLERQNWNFTSDSEKNFWKQLNEFLQHPFTNTTVYKISESRSFGRFQYHARRKRLPCINAILPQNTVLTAFDQRHFSNECLYNKCHEHCLGFEVRSLISFKCIVISTTS